MGHHFKTKDNSGHGSSCSELNIAKAQSNYCVLEQLMKVSCFLLSYKLGQEFNQDCSNNQDYMTHSAAVQVPFSIMAVVKMWI